MRVLLRVIVRHVPACGADQLCVVAGLRFSVSPVVRVTLSAPRAELNAKLENAMKAYSKTDPCIQQFRDPETRELVLAGAGELHLEVAVAAIANIAGFTPTSSTPVVTYRETVASDSPVVLAKSSNKLNRLFVRASPVRADLVQALEDGGVNVDDAAKTARVLAKKCALPRSRHTPVRSPSTRSAL